VIPDDRLPQRLWIVRNTRFEPNESLGGIDQRPTRGDLAQVRSAREAERRLLQVV
jgi:hypothetical protein